jgi:phage pi2 protein 07
MPKCAILPYRFREYQYHKCKYKNKNNSKKIGCSVDVTEFRKTLTAEERIEQASAKALDHINRKNYLNSRQRTHAKQWTVETAHAVFELHPELREENSLIRYFVAKAGRAKGIYARSLSEFVEQEYQQGTWWKHIPPEVLKSSM